MRDIVIFFFTGWFADVLLAPKIPPMGGGKAFWGLKFDNVRHDNPLVLDSA